MSKKTEETSITGIPATSDSESAHKQKVRELAYQKAEQEDFTGEPTQYWYDAENEIRES
jgi:hypothetical protein